MDINKYPEVNFSLDNGKMESSSEFAKQREKRGWDDTECWNLDSTIASFIIPRLKVFKEIHKTHPCELSDKQWEEIIDKMILAFELSKDDWWEYNSDKEREEGNIKMKEGLELFAKYFTHLWD